MGILQKSKKIKQDKADAIALSKPELQFILKLIANSAFQGKDLQLIYDLTAKLQKQYSD